jgi:hypothetical protein
MEKGLMIGFGKPVILFIDDRSNLPSDFNRNFVVSYKSKNYLEKFEKLVEKIKGLANY